MNVRPSITQFCEKRADSKYSNWNSIDWKLVRVTVNRLQTRIAKAIQEGKHNLVRRLQYLLTHSYHAKLLAVRIVTQNRGKRTPGVDNILWLMPEDKLNAVSTLSDKRYRSRPLKRIFIPKFGKDGYRPLSIPTMYDRAMQALYALSLQPVAETLADPRSFGFRLFRSTKDCAQYLHICLRRKGSAEWVLEGDIKGCFDNISHDWLLKHVQMDKSVLRQFLKSGFIYQDALFPSDLGTPQGGIISPILANITLDGMEQLISDKYPAKLKVHFVRYADDFVVTSPSEEIAKEIKILIANFLVERGLTLSDSKTKITHITDGFDFLGWNIRKYNGVLLSKPSKESLKKVTKKIGDIIHKAAAWDQDRLIQTLNPVIIGWTNYHRHICASDTFDKMNSIIWEQLWRWAKRRHKDKGHKWTAKRYWRRRENRNWVFASDKCSLRLFSDTRIQRHFMHKLDANPYLDKKYFISRLNRINRRTPEFQTKLTYFPVSRPSIG